MMKIKVIKNLISFKMLLLGLLFIVLDGLVLASSQDSSARVLNIRGDVFYIRQSQNRPLEKSSKLIENDIVSTGSSGRVKLLLADGGNEVVLGPSTQLKIVKMSSQQRGESGTHLHLNEGSVRSSVYKKYSGEGSDVFKVTTPNAVAGVRGTRFTVVYESGKRTSQIYTESGLVAWQAVSSNRGEYLVGAEMFSEIIGEVSKSPIKIQKPSNRIQELIDYDQRGDGATKEEVSSGDVISETQAHYVDSSGNEIVVLKEESGSGGPSRSIASIPNDANDVWTQTTANAASDLNKKSVVDVSVVSQQLDRAKNKQANSGASLDAEQAQRIREITQQKALQNVPTKVEFEIK